MENVAHILPPPRRIVQPLCDFSADGMPKRLGLAHLDMDGAWFKTDDDLLAVATSKSEALAIWLESLEFECKPVVCSMTRYGARIEVVCLGVNRGTPVLVLVNRMTADVYGVLLNMDGDLSYTEVPLA